MGEALADFYSSRFPCGEGFKKNAVSFHQRLAVGFLKNLCWHLWFLISLKGEEVIFADDTAPEASTNEAG